jgi:hypothetical protein
MYHKTAYMHAQAPSSCQASLLLVPKQRHADLPVLLGALCRQNFSSGEFYLMKTSFSARLMARPVRALEQSWPHRDQLRSLEQLVMCMQFNRIEAMAGKADVAAGLAQKFRHSAMGQS